MAEMTPTNPDSRGSVRDVQLLNRQDMIVYEGIATLRRPMETDDLIATTGLEEPAVRAAVDHLTRLGMIINDAHGASIGPNDWDVRGAR